MVEETETWRPDCVCDSDPAHWRHRSDCPLRYWYSSREQYAKVVALEARCRELEAKLEDIKTLISNDGPSVDELPYAIDQVIIRSAKETAVKPPIGFGVPTLADRVKAIMAETGATFECALQTTAEECELRSEAIFAVRQYFDHYEPQMRDQ